VLDVGCGNGFLMLEAAKHLTTGRAIGIDVWVEDSGGQNAPAVWRNAQLEGVADKIDLQNVDARQMPFADHSFNVIVSSLALHHMGSGADREQALTEMARVLKPGGAILLYDMFPMIGQAASVMHQRSFKRIEGLGGLFLRVLYARK
jgi:arsenite methyltransferase